MTDEESRRPLQKQQEFLTAVLENVEDGIVACDAEGVLTLFNRVAREFHGLPEKPIPAEQWAEYYDLYLPDGKTRMSKEEIPLFRALQGEHVCNVEMVIAPKHGTARTLLASGRALFGSDGEKLGAVVIMHDITERQRAQDALKHESSLMQALMDNIPDAIYFKDTESRFTRVNRHAPYRAHTSPENVIGKTDFDFFIEEHARAAYEDEQRIIRTGQPMIDKEEKETYPDGSITWLSTTKVPIFDESGRVTGIAGISRDITERKRAEEERIQLIREQAARVEAEAANRLKDEFLAIVSHELRTPLTPILGWSNLLRTGKCDQALLVRGLEIIERSAKSQAQLVDDLLDVSRIISGKLRLAVRPTELKPIIDAAVDSVQPAAAAKGIHLQVILEPEAEPISGDPDRLQQVVWNLLSNAIKFTPKGGRVEIRLERAQSHVEIRVSDTGVGIRPEFLPHVFARFSQADSSITRTYGGLGLGLSIVRHLVELHGGSVQVDSPGEGKGTTFTVKLPLATGLVELSGSEHLSQTHTASMPLESSLS
ncbi:MAG TPA: PAS domain-containing sensor histidine kinase, partial [Pyrinomonadaceae bacterium]|nr:PAS domain-containing sensor histidine kinase [Pyrinomonadaceae bacterium]